MARKQVIVQLEDKLVAELDRLARREGLSRSELLRRAARALIESRRIARLEKELTDAYRRVPQDPDIVEAAKRLAAEAPPW